MWGRYSLFQKLPSGFGVNLTLRTLALVLLLVAMPPAHAFDWVDPVDRYADDLVSDDASTRLAAVHRLGALESDDIEPVIVKALLDKQSTVAIAAAQIATQRGFTAAQRPLTRWLRSPRTALRITAAKGLARIGDATSVTPLTRILNDSEARVRLAVVNALAAIRSPKAVSPLLRQIDDPASDVRAAILKALVTLADPRATPYVMGKLADPVPLVRGAAARALGQLGDQRSAPSLVALLNDSNDGVVVAATRAIGQLRHAPATREVAALLERPSADLREHAALALARIGTATSVRTLARGLEQQQLHDEIRQALRSAPPDLVATALRGVIDDPHTTEPTLRAAVWLAADLRLTALQPLLIDLLERQRLPSAVIARALGRLADRRSQRALLTLTDDPAPETRLAALESLRDVADERARDVIRALLDDPHRRIRLAALELVGQLRDPRSIPALDDLCSSTDLTAARAAARALARMDQRDQPQTTPILLRLLRHHDAEMRRMAVEALLNARESPTVTELIRTCRAASGSIRADCLQAFGSALRTRPHQAALSFLRQELGRGHDAIQAAAISVISTRTDGTTTALLVEVLSQLPVPLRAQALDTLNLVDASSRRDIARLLRAHLDAQEPVVRAAAAWAVGSLRLHSFAATVRQLVHTQQWASRVNAVATLVRLSSPTDCALFRLLLIDRDPYVRANAALGLGECPKTLGVRQLTERLSDESSPWVRLNLLRAVLQRGAASQSSAKALNDGQQPAALLHDVINGDPDPRVRASARQLLQGRTTNAKRWIGLYLLDEQGRPLRSRPIALILPSGLVKATNTDVRAQHWEQNLTPGSCYVERPGPEVRPLVTWTERLRNSTQPQVNQ